MKRVRVVVAMSGGVDSSTAAALLLEAGHEVVGVTLKLTDATGTAASVGGRCCGPRDIDDARATAAALRFPHYVLDETAAFKELVIDDFVAEHRLGRTPNPCVRCNEKLKFAPLIRFASAVGAERLATGHYARLERCDEARGASAGTAGGLAHAGGGGEDVAAAASVRLRRSLDARKDQSYFLFGVAPELLERVMFPLGVLTKLEVRDHARRFKLPNAEKPDSQQICFVPDGDHVAFVEAHGGAGRVGEIVDEAGRKLGEHDGTHRFTVGQRRGVPTAGPDRRFVIRIDGATGRVVTGTRAATAVGRLHVADLRWTAARNGLDLPARAWPLRCNVQIRHHAEALPAWVEEPRAGACVVTLDGAAHGAAPGQAAVFYEGDRVLGGGWISADPALGPERASEVATVSPP